MILFFGMTSTASAQTVLESWETSNPLNDYSGETGDYSTTTSRGFDQSTSVEKTTNDQSHSGFYASSPQMDFSNEPVNISCRLYYDGSSATRGGCGFFSSDGSGGYIAYFDSNGGAIYPAEMSSASIFGNSHGGAGATSFTISDAQWVKVVLKKNSDTYTAYAFKEDGTLLDSYTMSDSTYSVDSEAVWAYDAGFEIDYLCQNGCGSSTEEFNISVKSPLNSTVSDSAPELNYTIDGSADSCKYNVDDGANQTLSSCQNTTFSILSDGFHKVTVWANNSNGAWTNATRYFSIDSTPPSKISNIKSYLSSDWINLEWSEGSDTEKVQVSLNGEKKRNTTLQSYYQKRLDNGTKYNFTLTSIDDAGNKNTVYYTTSTYNYTTFKNLNVVNSTFSTIEGVSQGFNRLRYNKTIFNGSKDFSSHSVGYPEVFLNTSSGKYQVIFQSISSTTETKGYVESNSLSLADWKEEVQILNSSFKGMIDTRIDESAPQGQRLKMVVGGDILYGGNRTDFTWAKDLRSVNQENFWEGNSLYQLNGKWQIIDQSGDPRDIRLYNTTGNFTGEYNFQKTIVPNVLASNEPYNFEVSKFDYRTGQQCMSVVSRYNKSVTDNVERFDLWSSHDCKDYQDTGKEILDEEGISGYQQIYPGELVQRPDKGWTSQYIHDVSSSDHGNYPSTDTRVLALSTWDYNRMGYFGGVGNVTTQSLPIGEKDVVYVNADGSSLKAEVLDSSGGAIDGYRKQDFDAVTGNVYHKKLSWNGVSGLPSNSDKLRFYLNGGKFYSYTIFHDSSSSVNATTDITPPSSSDNWSASGFVDKSSATVEITATDSESSVSNVSYRVNGGSYTTVQGSSATVTITEEGDNLLEYYATDSKGNQESVNTEDVRFETLNKNKTVDTFSDLSLSSPPVDWTVDREEGSIGADESNDKTFLSSFHPANSETVNRIQHKFDGAFQKGESISFSADMSTYPDDTIDTTSQTEFGIDQADIRITWDETVTNESEARLGISTPDPDGTLTGLGFRVDDASDASSPSIYTFTIKFEDYVQYNGENRTELRYTVTREDGKTIWNQTKTSPEQVKRFLNPDVFSFNNVIFLSNFVGNQPDDSDLSQPSVTYKPYIPGNSAPQFASIPAEFRGDDTATVDVGDNLTLEVDAFDPDSNLDTVDVAVRENGQQIYSDTFNQGRFTTPKITDADAAVYNATITATDTEGLSTTVYETETVTEDAPTINFQNPVDGESHTYLNSESGREINFRADFQDNNLQFDGSYTVYLNDTSIKTESFTSSDWTENNEIIVDFNDTVSAGTYVYTLNVTNSETGNTFDSASQGEANTFTVESVEEQPKFSLNSPVDGSELFFNNNTASSKNVTFKGSSDTSFSGSADVLLDGVKVGGFSVSDGSNSYEEYASVGEGEHSYKVRVTSDDTGNTYESSTTSFNVTGVDEVPPKIGGLKPEGPSYTSDKLDSSFSYSFFVDSEINGTAEYYVSDGAKELFNITTGKEVDPVNQTFSGSFTIPEEHRYVGFYELVAEVTSEKNNVYTEKIDIYFKPDTEFYNLTPVNETISAENSTSKVVDLSGIVEPSVPGTLEIQVKEPGESSYSTLTSDYYSNVFNENRSFTYSVNFTDIDYPNIVDNKSVSDDYQWKAVYNLNNSFTGSVNDVYSSGPKTLKFSQGAPGFFERQLNLIRNLLKDTVPPAIGLLAVVALIFKTSKETGGDTTTILIVAAASVAGLAYIGFFPLAEYIYGLPGFIGLILLILYLANNLGEVMT